MATITNTKKQLLTLNLVCPEEHREDPDFGYQEITSHVTEHMKDGTHGVRVVERKLPNSITLLANETREGLPAWILHAPEVKAALARGALRVVSKS